MTSLSNIPEPTTGYRPTPEDAAPAAHVSPLAAGLSLNADHRGHIDPETGKPDQPEHQVDSVSCLLLLLVAGGLLRVVLGLLGPVQGGLDEVRVQQLGEQADAILAGKPVSAYPLFELLSGGLLMTGLPGWCVVALGSLITLGAVPAAYIVGRATTGRRVSGILAAALVAVHPAVLTASNALSPGALALGLVTIGLALLCHAPKRGTGYAVGGGLLLGLAGLAAPLCWVIGALAGPLTVRLSRREPVGKAISHALVVMLLALTPVAGYRALVFGTGPAQLAPEFVKTQAHNEQLSPIDRLLVTMTDPSLAELGDAMHLPLGNAGRLTVLQQTTQATSERRDIVADTLADGWVLMNAALAGFATLSVGVMLARRRFVEVLALAGPLCATAFCVLPPGEALRLPMLALVGVLAVGLFANRVVIDEAALAAKAQKNAAKQAARDEKQRAKQEQTSRNELGKLYAFDKPSRSEKKARKKQAAEQAKAPAGSSGILTERVADDASIPARPI